MKPFPSADKKKWCTLSDETKRIYHMYECEIELFHPRGQNFVSGARLAESLTQKSDPEGGITLSHIHHIWWIIFLHFYGCFFASKVISWHRRHFDK